jgi:DNA-binding response OmpR family regulator
MFKARLPRLVLGACRMMHSTAAIRVLLVEPHADTRELYAFGLASMGWEVVTAMDAASAHAAFKALRPAVVVSETWLPDGGEVALLRAFADTGIPIIAMTTAPPDQHDAFSGLGLSAVVLKPCLPEELARAIRAVSEPADDGS